MKKIGLVFSFVVFLIFFLIGLLPIASANVSSAQKHLPTCQCDIPKELSYQEPNMQGNDVRDLQLELAQLGLYKGTVDGVFGPITLAAIKKFQSEHNISPTGVVDLKVWQILEKTLANKTVAKKVSEPPTGKIEIIIDITKRKLTIFSDGEPFKQYPCAVGKAETPTPVGNWKVKYKAMNWGTGFGTRWHGLNVPWGIFGIHGTNKPGSIGSYASHGCIRMWNKNVEEIYPWIPKGAPVYIVGNPFGVNWGKNTVVNGSRGTDAMLVQKRLKQWGYLDGPVDGVFGYGSEAALKKFQKDFKLRVDGQVNKEDYDALKLR